MTDRAAVRWLLVALALAAFLLFQPWEGQGFDENGYNFWLTSLLFDGDLDVTNDRLLSAAEVESVVWERELIAPTGNGADVFSVGPALIWSVGVAPWVTLERVTLGPMLSDQRDRNAYRLRVVVSIISFLLACHAVILLHHALRHFYSPGVSAAAASVAVLGSPLLIYMTARPTMAHALSLWASTMLWWLTLRAWRDGPRRPGARDWALGLAVGLTALVRWQAVVWALVPAAMYVAWMRRPGQRGAAIAGAVHAAVASTLVFSIQLAVWKVVYGQWFIVPQGGGFLFGDRALALGQVLFSRWSGLISFHPWIALALVGLVIWARRAPALAGGAFLALAATWIINAGVKDWWAGVAFGARRWDAAFPLFALGAAAMLSLLPAGAARRVIGGGLCIALIGFNAVLGLLWSRAVLQEHWLELRPVARDLAATMLGHPGAWIESSMWKMFQARPENLAAALALTALVIAGLAAVAFISRGGRAPWPRGRRAMWTTCAVTLYVLLALAAVVWKGARPAPHRAEHLALREILLATEDDQERWGALQPLATAPDASCPALIAIGARTALRARNQTAGNQAAARDLLLDLEATAPHFAWYQTLLSVDDAEARDRALRALLENPRWGDAQFQRLVRREVVRQPDRALVSKLVAIPTADQSEILYARVEWARHEQQLIVEEELLPRVLHRLPHDVYSLRRLVELTEHRGDEETAAKWRENGGRWADAQLQTLERFARVDRPHVVAVRRPQVGHLAQSMIAMLDPDTQADRSWRTVERVRALLDPGDSMVVDLLHERLYRQWEGAREAPPGPRRARLLARIEAFADEWPWDVSGQTALIHTLSMHGRWADACAVLTEAESRFGEGPVIRELADWLVRDFPLEARGAIDCTLVPVSVRAQVADEIAARFSE